MSWREEIEPDWFHDAPFYLAAIIAHGALITLNPAIRWGSGASPIEKAVPIEFVADVPPPPTVNLAPTPAGDGTNAPPRHGPGKLQPERVKSGALDPPPKATPKPKPAAVKSKVNKAGATVQKRLAAEARAQAQLRVAEEAKRQHIAAERAAERAAEQATERAAEKKAERARLAAEARAEAQVRAAEARAAAEVRAQAAREAAEARAQAAEARAAAEAERRQLAAEAKAAKARKRAELSQTLDEMSDPGEGIAAGRAAGAAGATGASGRGSAQASSGRGSGSARMVSAAAALAESTDPGDAAGSGGGDLIDANPTGGGTGPEGGGVSWSVDGPVGNRRILSRVSPESPDWIATRNLDLTVTVRFQVLPDGSVKSGAVIQKTSGFPEIDRLALQALRRWRFQTVPAKSGAPEVWGRVAFRFTS